MQKRAIERRNTTIKSPRQIASLMEGGKNGPHLSVAFVDPDSNTIHSTLVLSANANIHQAYSNTQIYGHRALSKGDVTQR